MKGKTLHKIFIYLSPNNSDIPLTVIVILILIMRLDVSITDTRCEEADNTLHTILWEDPEDCARFLQCDMNGTLMSLPCVFGTFFNFQHQVCVQPDLTQPSCSNWQCYGKSHVFVAGSECGTWSYCVDGGISHSDQCPHDLSFVEETQFCTYPFCSSSNATTVMTTEEDGPCPANIGLFDRFVLPHPTDCTIFYICSFWIRSAFSCPPGQIFHYPSQMCRPDTDVVCTPLQQ